MRAKVVILPKTAEKLLPPAYRKRGGGGGGGGRGREHQILLV